MHLILTTISHAKGRMRMRVQGRCDRGAFPVEIMARLSSFLIAAPWQSPGTGCLSNA